MNQLEEAKNIMSFTAPAKVVVGLGNGKEPSFPGKLIDFRSNEQVEDVDRLQG